MRTLLVGWGGVLLLVAGCGGGGADGFVPTATAPTYEQTYPNGHPLSVSTTSAEILSPEEEMERLINEYRVSLHLNALIDDAALRKVARAHSEHMILHAFVDHVNPEGQWPWDRAVSVGISQREFGETIAVGQATARQAFADLLSSPTHRAVIEDPAWTHIGCGYAVATGTVLVYYWTQNFKRE